MTGGAMPSLLYSDPPELDHIVHLVSPGKLMEAVEQFRHLGFSVERGGVHADGLTQNALIVLTDGVYIELIEFLEKPIKGHANSGGAGATKQEETLQAWKQRRSEHWWWGRQVGWIDWCLRGGVQDGRIHALNAASRRIAKQRTSEKGEAESVEGQFVDYNEPAEGGRRALSGKKIRWNVVFPVVKPESIQRGTYPFWCEDKTPRWWRVPTPSPPHENLTRGLSALTLLYYPETFPARLASIQLVLSSKQTSSAEKMSDVLQTIVDPRPPPKTEGKTALPDSYIELYLATPEGPLLPLRIKAADDPAELEWLAINGEGLFEVEISVAPEKLPITAPPDGIERDTHKKGYGRLRLHPMRATVVPSS